MISLGSNFLPIKVFFDFILEVKIERFLLVRGLIVLDLNWAVISFIMQ